MRQNPFPLTNQTPCMTRSSTQQSITHQQRCLEAPCSVNIPKCIRKVRNSIALCLSFPIRELRNIILNCFTKFVQKVPVKWTSLNKQATQIELSTDTPNAQLNFEFSFSIDTTKNIYTKASHSHETEPSCVVYSTLNHYTSAQVLWLLGQSVESTESREPW